MLRFGSFSFRLWRVLYCRMPPPLKDCSAAISLHCCNPPSQAALQREQCLKLHVPCPPRHSCFALHSCFPKVVLPAVSQKLETSCIQTPLRTGKANSKCYRDGRMESRIRGGAKLGRVAQELQGPKLITSLLEQHAWWKRPCSGLDLSAFDFGECCTAECHHPSKTALQQYLFIAAIRLLKLRCRENSV